jgi:gamma-glutamyltranspeptidase/glutathione hydrolase
MGGFNQAQAHAQFVANVVDYGFDIQAGARGGTIHEGYVHRRGRERRGARPSISAGRADRDGARGDDDPPRTGAFGHGQAVMSDGTGVHFGASEPRHDGAAISEAPPTFADHV